MGVSEERAVPIPVEGTGEPGLVLDGLYVATTEEEPAGAVIAPPHPLYGGSMDSPVVNELAQACDVSGIATLRFNWRGVGGSGGARSGEESDADADFGAAIAQMAETVPGPLLVCGYSFGAATAVRCARANPRTTRMMLVAPPPSMLDDALLTGFAGKTLLLAGEHDTMAPPATLAAIAAENDRIEFVPIPEADHFFAFGLAELGRQARRFLSPG